MRTPILIHQMLRCSLVVAVIIATMVLAAVLTTIYWFDPAQHAFYPKCLLHSFTGWNCAGCGSLRATHHLLHGELRAAFQCNALLVLAMGVPVWVGFRWLRGERPVAVLRDYFSRTVLVVCFLGVTIVFTVLRNLPRAGFAWLNP